MPKLLLKQLAQLHEVPIIPIGISKNGPAALLVLHDLGLAHGLNDVATGAATAIVAEEAPEEATAAVFDIGTAATGAASITTAAGAAATTADRQPDISVDATSATNRCGDAGIYTAVSADICIDICIDAAAATNGGVCISCYAVAAANRSIGICSDAAAAADRSVDICIHAFAAADGCINTGIKAAAAGFTKVHTNTGVSNLHVQGMSR